MKQKIRPYVPFIIIAVVGLLIMGMVWPYYAFHWGVKLCTGMPTDPANCGDGDMGGVWFVLVGLPVTMLGIVGLVARWAVMRLRGKK